MKQLSKKKVKERRKVGIVKAYMSRAAAVKRLQVPLSDFRRLCILKGVYPVEPKNKSKLTGGNTRRKTYFFSRDIQFLMNEPILYKFWEFKVFMKRLTRAKGRHDLEKFNQVLENKPIYQLDSVVKERYPRFVDALRDCDDALSMCFLFAMFPKAKGRPEDLIDLSRKLTIEFMHYVIHTKSLRKVFISIKGYYYQADIMGQTITWIVPHQFVIDRISNVDLNVMKTFTEFYITLLGFINFKLYKSINAVYPPQTGRVDEDEVEAAALNKQIRILENKSIVNAEKEDQQPDVFEDTDETDKMTFQQTLALERLFAGLKFFLGREVPRESLTFIIRSFGGEVTWTASDESDPTITHQIVDRSSMAERRLDRVYVQPQWAYDCINARILLPTADYLMGATLPPHLSPFVNEKRGDYVPPDKVKLMNLRKQFDEEKAYEKGEVGLESDRETDAELEREPEPAAKKMKTSTNKSTSRSKMGVKKGKPLVENKAKMATEEDQEARKLGILMIPKKKKRLFDKITKTQKQRKRKTEKMRAKRRIVDAVAERQKKSVKKFAHKTAHKTKT